jgi:hypothetical protein
MSERTSNLLTYYPQGDIYPHRDERIDLAVDEEGRLVDRTTKRPLSAKELKEMDYSLANGHADLYCKDADGYNIPTTRGRISELLPTRKKPYVRRCLI